VQSNKEPQRKTSTGFLGRFRPSSIKQQGSPAANSPNGSGRTLRALRSIGSLKSKSSTPPSTISKATSPQLPQPAEFDGFGITLDGDDSHVSTSPAAETPSRPSTSRAAGGRSISFGASMRSGTSSALSVPPSPVASAVSAPPAPYAAGTAYQAALGNALIAASHAESAKGTHGDLLQILNHDERPWGFSYHAYPHRVRVWYGDRDERIAEHAVRWMERNMGEARCRVEVVPGADHGLMYNSAVVVEVLEAVAEEWKERETAASL
jgi:pimeloyl-ACP methyl ester carboxylesterase